MKLSIIIPVFNEEKTIGRVLEKVSSVLMPGISKEIIVVDDGSNDATASVISNLKSQISNLKSIRHKTNLGKGSAVRTGIENVTGDYLVIQDADLEYDPKDIQKLIIPILKNEAKVVYGTRLRRWPNLAKDERHPRFLIHYCGNKFLSLMTSILYGQWITDMETCYKLFPKEAFDNIVLNSKGFDFEPEITAKLMKKRYRIKEIPIKTEPRGYKEGKKLNTVKDGIKAFYSLLKYRFID